MRQISKSELLEIAKRLGLNPGSMTTHDLFILVARRAEEMRRELEELRERVRAQAQPTPEREAMPPQEAEAEAQRLAEKWNLSSVDREIVQLLLQRMYVHAMQLHRYLTGTSLREAKDHVDALQQRFSL